MALELTCKNENGEYHIFYCWDELKDYKNKIIKLDCSNNNLMYIPEFNFLKSLKVLDCSNNNLISINNLQLPSLKELYCFNNNLTTLPKLPLSLEKLYCYNNNLDSLPNINLEYLQELNCGNNNLTSLPDSLIEWRNLKEIYLYDNEIEYTTQQINFINLITRVKNTIDIYKNKQNVHNSYLKKCLFENINKLMKKID